MSGERREGEGERGKSPVRGGGREVEGGGKRKEDEGERIIPRGEKVSVTPGVAIPEQGERMFEEIEDPGAPLTLRELCPLKPPGSVGRAVQVSTNFFTVNFYSHRLYSIQVKFDRSIDELISVRESIALRVRLVERVFAPFLRALLGGFYLFDRNMTIFAGQPLPAARQASEIIARVFKEEQAKLPPSSTPSSSSSEVAPQQLEEKLQEGQRIPSESPPQLGEQLHEGQHIPIKAPSGDKIVLTLEDPNGFDPKDGSNEDTQYVMQHLLKNRFRFLDFVQLGRASHYFSPKGRQLFDHDRPLDAQVFTGFRYVVRPCREAGLTMCIDLAHRVMRHSNVRQLMNRIGEAETEYGRRRNFPTNEIEERIAVRVNEELRGKTVTCMYNLKVWTIDSVDFSLSIDSSFKRKDGLEMSFREYYETRWNLRVASSNLGLLVHKPKKGVEKITYLVPDYCYITGFTQDMRADFILNKALANESRVKPGERARQIENHVAHMLESVNQAAEKNPHLKEMYSMLQVDGQRMKFRARILPPVEIISARQRLQLQENRPDFKKDSRDFGFFDMFPNQDRPTSVIEVRNWAFMYSQAQRDIAMRFNQTFRDLANKQGARMEPPALLEIQDRGGDWGEQAGEWYTAALGAVESRQPYTFLVFLVPSGNETIYSAVKLACASGRSLISQGVSEATLKRDHTLFNPVAGNCFKQLMAKLGYGLWRVETHPKLKNCMMIGMDVCHESRPRSLFQGRNTENIIGSVAAFCASYDPYCSQFVSFLSGQKRNEDYIRESGKMLARALQRYQAFNQRLPESILVFRDGVSNSQLNSFVRHEIDQLCQTIRAFCAASTSAQTSSTMLPIKLTVVVVQKQTGVRIFSDCPTYHNQREHCPQFKCDGREPVHTPVAGTVVDTNIVSPLLSDFYLCPTLSPPGATARPTRYITVRDDIGFTSDELQMITYRECHAYVNWQGSVRVPACVMLAHKLAFLYGKAVNGQPSEKWNDLGKTFFL